MGQDQQAAILNELKTSMARVEIKLAGLHRTNTTFIFVGTGASALATLVAGITAAAGPVVGDGIDGWRLACIAAAVLSACGGLATALQQQFTIADRLAAAKACAGKLRALEVALSVSRRDPTKVAQEYEQLTAEYRELFL
jgi:hypothetical protein